MQVRQHTGEHWDQVQLTLSTAQPSLGGILLLLKYEYHYIDL